jgi:GH18 family chitinase
MGYKYNKNSGLKHQTVFLLGVLWVCGCLRADKLVVGYYPSWFKSVLPAEDIQFENLTHINHAFAWPESNGQIHTDFGFIYPELNNLAHENHVQILISLGGWGHSDGFSPMAADTGKRSIFIESLVDLLTAYDYDGVDIDWESPGTVADRNNLTLLIRELSQRFELEDPDWLITFAVGTSDWTGQWIIHNCWQMSTGSMPCAMTITEAGPHIPDTMPRSINRPVIPAAL